jgi:glycosyltransferase involved in cell wall biosynthesis
MSDSIPRNFIPKVSVFMAVYQQRGFIREALDSVLIQNYPNTEVIIGDDGSTDGTQEILKEYAHKYPDLIRLLLAKENTGITDNCNRILKECTGQYIAFMAGDDIWLPGKIQAQVDYLESHPHCSICYHNLEVFDSDSGKTLYYFNGPEAIHPGEGKAEIAVQYGTFNGAISNMVRRSDCPPHGFDSRVSMASDWLFWVDILLNGGEIHYLDRVFARYRKHKNNITQLTQLRNFREHLKSANIIFKKRPGMIKEVLFRKADIYNMLMHRDGNRYRRRMWSIYRKLNVKIYNILSYFNNLAKTILGGISTASKKEISFPFGKNWEHYVKTSFSDERVEISRKHLLVFLERNDLKGASFLDIGCGSGLHSYAAYRAGATHIISIDVDIHSVKTTTKIREMAGNPPNWSVLQGSVLDADFMSTIEPVDIVYSWGVLHHTGNLWQAVKNASIPIKPGGLFYIALYEKTAKSDYWIRIKKKYNSSSKFGKLLMELSYVSFNSMASAIVSGTRALINSIKYIANYKENRGMSIKYIANYKENRGMSFMTDIRDWLGGWPYEPATPEEVTDYCVNKLGLLNQKIKTGEANIEYLFQKK